MSEKYLLVSPDVNRLLLRNAECILAINQGLNTHFTRESNSTLIDVCGVPVWIKTSYGTHYIFTHKEPLSHPINTTLVKLKEKENGTYEFPE